MALNSMDRIQFQKRPCPQEKKIEQQRQRSYHKRPQAVVNNFPENQDAFKKPNVLSGNLASKNEGTYRNKNNKVFLIGDSH